MKPHGDRGVVQGHVELRDAYRDERVARDYIGERFRSPLGALLHARQRDVLRRVIRENRIEQAVELAPGPARLTVEAAPVLRTLTVLDSSRQMLDEARARLAPFGRSVRLLQADAFRLPLRASVSLVYSFRLIRHFERTDRVRLYRETASILKPGGLLVFDAVNATVSAPLRARSKPGEYQHYDALLRPEEIRQELEEGGLELLRLDAVQHRYELLAKCQIYIAPRSAWIARVCMEWIDRSGGEPLEWVVTCRRV